MVEFALASILMITLCGGIFQFGYSMYLYNSLISQVRSAARYASAASYTSTTSTPTQAYANAVRNVVVYGSPTTSSGTPVVAGLTRANVQIQVTMNGTTAREITVRIVNYTVDALFGRITFNQKPSVTFIYNG
jgi:Flp pilus assembly protein TadG